MVQTENKVRLQSDRARIWKVVRYFKGEFKVNEIAVVAEASYQNTKRYLRALCQAGYIKKFRKDGKYIIYKLIKSTGPLPPVQKEMNFVYDPNTDDYWIEDPEKLRQKIIKRVKNELA